MNAEISAPTTITGAEAEAPATAEPGIEKVDNTLPHETSIAVPQNDADAETEGSTPEQDQGTQEPKGEIEDFLSAGDDIAAEDIPAEIARGLDLLRRTDAAFAEDDQFDAVSARQAITRGKILHRVKDLVLKAGLIKWKDWRDVNVRFLSKRTVETYIQLAGCHGSERYAFLGKERLLSLIRVVDDSSAGDDPIASLLQANGVEVSCDTATERIEAKRLVDALIVKAKLKKGGVDAPMHQVRRLMASDIALDTDVVTHLKREVAGGMTLDAAIDQISAQGTPIVGKRGRGKAPRQEDRLLEGTSMLLDVVNKLATQPGANPNLLELKRVLEQFQATQTATNQATTNQADVEEQARAA